MNDCPCRLRIAACLFSGPKNVSELVALTNTSIAKTSHHLRVLREADLVLSDKQGRFVIYSLHPKVTISGPGTGAPNLNDLGFRCLSLLQPV